MNNKARKLTVLLIILIIPICISIIWGANRAMNKYSYVEDASLLELSEDDLINDGWVKISDKVKDDIGMLNYRFTRWRKGDLLLTAVFSKGTIKEYILMNQVKKSITGSIKSGTGSFDILKRLAANDLPIPFCDIGSGFSINAALTCDGRIVTWYDNGKGTFIFDAFTLEQTNEHFIYRLIHGIL